MRRLYQLFALLGALAFVAFLCRPVFSGPSGGPSVRNVYKARQLAIGCLLYAEDHQGKFPMHLSELEPDYILKIGDMRCVIVARGKKTESEVDWLYFGAGFDVKSPPHLLIASPQAVKTQRVFITGDTAGQVGKEDQFQTLLAETVKQMQALDESRRAKTPPVEPLKPPEN